MCVVQESEDMLLRMNPDAVFLCGVNRAWFSKGNILGDISHIMEDFDVPWKPDENSSEKTLKEYEEMIKDKRSIRAMNVEAWLTRNGIPFYHVTDKPYISGEDLEVKVWYEEL